MSALSLAGDDECFPTPAGTAIFLLDTALQRMDNERGFNNVLCWLAVFNTLGGAAPLIRSLWSRWWALDTPGKSGVCAIQYAAHLIYPIEANPLWSQEWIGWGASIRP